MGDFHHLLAGVPTWYSILDLKGPHRSNSLLETLLSKEVKLNSSLYCICFDIHFISLNIHLNSLDIQFNSFWTSLIPSNSFWNSLQLILKFASIHFTIYFTIHFNLFWNSYQFILKYTSIYFEITFNSFYNSLQFISNSFQILTFCFLFLKLNLFKLIEFL